MKNEHKLFSDFFKHCSAVIADQNQEFQTIYYNKVYLFLNAIYYSSCSGFSDNNVESLYDELNTDLEKYKNILRHDSRKEELKKLRQLEPFFNSIEVDDDYV
jgi:glutaredoxin-related protein